MGNAAPMHKNVEKDANLDYTGADLVASKSLVLCLNASSLCTMVYRNSIRSSKYKDFESENLTNMGIIDYKIWTYADNFELVVKNLEHKPAVSAQFTTGVISHIESDQPYPLPFICFGGTISLYEVIADLSSVIHCESKTLRGEVIGTTGYGIKNVYQTFRAFGIVEFITNLMKKHNSGLLVTGHSLGGAVALLFVCELLIDYPELFENKPVRLVTFGAPRVLTSESVIRIQALMQKMPLLQFIRVVNKHDIITMLPPAKLGTNLEHFGSVLYIAKRDLQVHSGTFPRDREDWLDTMNKFLFSKAASHQMNSDEGYLPRFVAFCSTLEHLDSNQQKLFERFSKFACGRSLKAAVEDVDNDYDRSKHNFFNHFFEGPDKEVKCKLWSKLSHPNFTYPENSVAAHQTKEDIGIALSGDSLAAACLTLGWLRALHERGILKVAKYISSTGSASWVHVPMTFDHNEQLLNDFLGPYIAPENCTIAAVEGSVSSGHGKILANNKILSERFKIGLQRISASLFRHGREIDVWSETVGAAFLEPYGIDSSDSSLPALDGDHAHRVRDLTTGWVDSVHATRTIAEHPFPIVNASVFIGSSRGFLPVEFTPMYYGIIPYHEVDHCHGIGGCLIEPHGFTSKPAAFELSKQMLNLDPKSGVFCVAMDVLRPKFVLTMQEILGISSSNMAVNADPLSGDGSFDELYFPIFPTFSSECPGDHFANREQFVDGQYSDYTGIIALLRRKCKFVIACIAANADILSGDVENAKIHNLGNLAGLFGRQRSGKCVNGVTDDVFNSQRQVFSGEAWDELLTKLRFHRHSKNSGYSIVVCFYDVDMLMTDGKLLVHRMTLEVLPNPMVVVPGMHRATVVFCISGECQQWTDALPAEMQKKLFEDNAEPPSFMEEQAMQFGLANANLNKFPHIPIERKVFSSLTTGLLAQFAAFQLSESGAMLNVDLD